MPTGGGSGSFWAAAAPPPFDPASAPKLGQKPTHVPVSLKMSLVRLLQLLGRRFGGVAPPQWQEREEWKSCQIVLLVWLSIEPLDSALS